MLWVCIILMIQSCSSALSPGFSWNASASKAIEHSLRFHHHGNVSTKLGWDHDGWVFTISLWHNNLLCLDIAGGQIQKGAKLQLWECNGAEGQLFYFDSGKYLIQAAGNPNLCIDATQSYKTNGAALMLWDCNGLPQQVWSYDSNVGTIYLAKTSGNHKCMDCAGSSQALGTPLIAWDCTDLPNQQWSPTSGISIRLPGKLYQVCLDLTGGDTTPGTKVELWGCNGLPNQKWIFPANSYTIMYAADPTKCLDVGKDMALGNQLQIWGCNGQDQQRIGYDPSQKTLYLAKSSSDASLCLDLTGGSANPGTPVEVWNCNGCWNQQWDIRGPPSQLAASNSSSPRLSHVEACPPIPRPPVPTPPPAPPMTVLDHCHAAVGASTVGWPVFKDAASLSADAVWSKYFTFVYGRIPTKGYPICVYNFNYIYWQILKNAGFAHDPATTCPWKPKPPSGTYYSNMVRPPYGASFSASIYNDHQFAALPSNTWVEITHGAIGGATEAVGSWMYYAPGSAVWFNMGATKAYPDHDASRKEMCGKRCGFATLFTAAKAKGYSSIQYIQHADQSCGRVSGIDHKGREWAIEIVDTGGIGQYGCGALKTKWRAGWEAESECKCANDWADPAHGKLMEFNCPGFAMRHDHPAQKCGDPHSNSAPNIAGMPIASTDSCDCAAKCKAHARCVSWVFSTGQYTQGKKNCFLRSANGAPAYNCGGDCWSGLKPKMVMDTQENLQI